MLLWLLAHSLSLHHHPCSVLGIIHRYDLIKKMSPEQRKQVVPRVCIIGGKAAPGYEMAKRIIKLVGGSCVLCVSV
jgi:glucan phosphorylase